MTYTGSLEGDTGMSNGMAWDSICRLLARVINPDLVRIRCHKLAEGLDRLVLSSHEIAERDRRMEALQESLDYMREWFSNAEYDLRQGNFVRAASTLARISLKAQDIGIPAPDLDAWMPAGDEVNEACAQWMRNIAYACEIESYRRVNSAWYDAKKWHARRRELSALPK